MTAFSRNTTNEIYWDGSANLTLTDVSVGVIILTGNPGGSTGSGTDLFLPPTQNTRNEDNLLHGDVLYIQDPNGYLTSSNTLSVSANPNDTGILLNGSAGKAQVSTDTNLINLLFLKSPTSSYTLF